MRLGASTFEGVLGHNEFPNTPPFNHRSNICPGQNMNNVRQQARQTTNTTPAPSQPVNNAATHIVQRGETLSGIARQHRTTVAQLQRLNQLTNVHLIRVGQVLKLPSHAAADRPLQVGSRVRVNHNARTWLTGQTIPALVRSQIYDVQQIGRNGNHDHILIGQNRMATGWIHQNDLIIV